MTINQFLMVINPFLKKTKNVAPKVLIKLIGAFKPLLKDRTASDREEGRSRSALPGIPRTETRGDSARLPAGSAPAPRSPGETKKSRNPY